MADASGGSILWNLDIDDAQFQAKLTQSSESVDAFKTVVDSGSTSIDSSFNKISSSARAAIIPVSDLGKAADTAGGGFVTSSGEIEKAGGVAEESAGLFSKLGDTIKDTVLPLAALFVGYKAIEDIFTDVNNDTNTYNLAQAELENTLGKSNNTLGLTIKQLDNLADSNSKNTDITSAADLSAENLLSTYQLSTGVFKQASGTVNDLATSLSTKLGNAIPTLGQTNQAATLLGRALADPATAASTLDRAGVKLTTSQQSTVKAIQMANGVIPAQSQLLSDLSGVMSGKATAAVDTYQGHIASIQKTVYEFFGKYITDAQKALEKLGSAFTDIGAKILADKPILDILEGAFIAVSILGIGALISSLASLVIGFATTTAIVDGLEVTMLAPWIPIIAVVALVGGTIDLLVNKLGGWKQVMKDLTPYWNDFLTIWKVDIWPVLQVIGTYIGGLFLTAWKNIKNAFDKLWISIQPILPYLKDLGILIGGALLAALIIGAATIVLLVVAGAKLIAWAIDIISWIIQLVTHIINFDINFVSAIADLAKSVATDGLAIANWFEALPGKIMAVVSGAIDWLVGTGKDIIRGLSNGITSIFGDITGFFGGVGSRILSAVGSLGSLLYDVGTDIIQGLINGIEDSIKGVTKVVTTVANGIKSVAKGVLGIFSPSKEMRILGVYTGQGLAQGISSTAGIVNKATSDMISGVTNNDDLNLSANMNTSVGANIGASQANATGSSSQQPVTIHLNQSGIVARSRSEWRDIMKDGLQAVNEELKARRIPLIADGKIYGSSSAS